MRTPGKGIEDRGWPVDDPLRLYLVAELSRRYLEAVWGDGSSTVELQGIVTGGDPRGGRVTLENVDWMEHGACLGVDPDLFFPERGASTAEAKAVCAGCSVRHECLRFAIENHEIHGVWGGLSERQRRQIRVAEAEGLIAGRECGWCGRDFHPSSRTQRCCSRACAQSLVASRRAEAS